MKFPKIVVSPDIPCLSTYLWFVLIILPCWYIGLCVLIFLHGMPFFQFTSNFVTVYSVVDESVAMEAKIFKNDIFSVEKYSEV